MPINLKKTAQSLYLEEVKGSTLDEFLSRGWYRMGPSIFSTHYIYFEGTIYSCIWLRTCLDDYTYPKSLAKLYRKNTSRLTHTFEPVEYSDDLEDLFQKYRLTFKGNLPDTLSAYMMDSLDKNIYETYLVKVFAEDRLIACSIFDIGENSIASIFGFYDPAFSSMSLGLYTMLLEIEFAKQNAIQLYYIGYFVPGNPRFDYKLRIATIEYLDFKTRKWFTFDAFDYEDTPIKVIRRKLEILQSKLNNNYDVTIWQNAFIDVHIIELFPMKYLEDPVIILIKELPDFQSEDHIVVCTYDIRSQLYKLYYCEILDAIFSCYNPEWLHGLESGTYKQRLVIRKTLKTCKTTKPIERWIGSQFKC